MKISISDTKKISVIQKEFSDMFPFLKIEFFSKQHKKGEASPKKQMRSGTSTIGEIRNNHKKGEISIDPDQTVGEVEKAFADTFGLSVQVFRHSGKVWLETTATDSWTLKRQNEQGEELSKPVELG